MLEAGRKKGSVWIEREGEESWIEAKRETEG